MKKYGRPPLLIKLTKVKTFEEVLSKIRYKVKTKTERKKYLPYGKRRVAESPLN